MIQEITLRTKLLQAKKDDLGYIKITISTKYHLYLLLPLLLREVRVFSNVSKIYL